MSDRVYDIGDLIEDFDLESQFGNISYRDLVHGKYSLIVTFGSALEPCATTDIGNSIIISRISQYIAILFTLIHSFHRYAGKVDTRV